MNRAAEVVAEVEAHGGRLTVEDGYLVIVPNQAGLPFVGELRQHKAEIISLLREREAERDDRLRESFIAWFDSQVWIDARAVAQRLPPRWSTTVNTLFRDCRLWVLDHDQVPPTSEQFRDMLLELCCELRRIGEEEFVLNVALREDMDAHEKFQQPAPPPPAKRRRAAGRQR